MDLLEYIGQKQYRERKKMDSINLLQLKQRLNSIDWSGNLEKADKKHYETLDSLCEYIAVELGRNPKSESIDNALLLLSENIGCTEDFVRYEEPFINRLADKGMLTKEQTCLFYNNTNRRQG